MLELGKLFEKLEKCGYIILLVSLAFLFVLSPLIQNEKLGNVFEATLFAIVLFFSVVSLKPRKWVKVLAFVSAFIACVLWFLSHVFDHAFFNTVEFHLISGFFAMIFMFIVIVLILKDVLTNPKVDADLLCGSVCLYLLIGLVFCINYNVALLIDPNALKSSLSSVTFDAVSDLHSEALTIRYFSFVTLSTLGFGDIYPANSLARTMAWVEAVVGQIYLTVLVARLVGLHIANKTMNNFSDMSS